MAVCLVFTKSRTAAVATVCGLMLVGYRALRARGWSPGRMLVGGGIAAAGMVAVAAAALALGVWDREVLAEAPKSLGFRWLYWQGTARLIAERPLLGVGLGQFRSEYLRVKLPEASEEIADPHNIVLDAWVNGGLLAVMGLVLCGFSLIFGATMAKSTTEPNASGSWGVVGGGALAHALILTLEPWNDAVLVLGLAWAAAVAVWLPLATTGLGRRTALLTLGIHLLAAGGGGMPAVVLLGLVLLAISVTKVDGDVSREARPIAWKRPLLSWGLAILAVFVAALIWRPDAQCRELIAEGDRAAGGGNWEQATTHYVGALNRDRWNPTPAVHLGESHQQRLRNADSLSAVSRALTLDHALDEADKIYQIAMQRDPANGEWPYQLGRCWILSYKKTNQVEHAGTAAEWLHRAWQKYPTNAEWAADWAEAAQAAGQFDDARRAAEIALKQDDLNRQLGHVERWLPESRRNELINWKDSPEP